MKTLVIMVGALAITACASTQSTQLSENAHSIEMRGTASMSEAEASELAYLKAAETTISAGHRYFLVQTVDERTILDYVRTEGVSNHSLSGINVNTGAETYLRGSSGMMLFKPRVSSVTTPGLDAVIMTYADAPSAEAVDAFEVVALLGPRLNADRWTQEALEGLN